MLEKRGQYMNDVCMGVHHYPKGSLVLAVVRELGTKVRSVFGTYTYFRYFILLLLNS